MRVSNEVIFNTTVSSVGTAIITKTSEIIDISHQPLYCIHAIWSGVGAKGTAWIQKSVDKENFVTEGSAMPISGAGSSFQSVVDAAYHFVRLVVSTGTNTITMKATMNGKGV